MNVIHELKCYDPYYEPIWRRHKKHDIRINDRDFQVGDILIYKQLTELELIPTGYWCAALVTYITDPCLWINDMPSGFVVMSIYLMYRRYRTCPLPSTSRLERARVILHGRTWAAEHRIEVPAFDEDPRAFIKDLDPQTDSTEGKYDHYPPNDVDVRAGTKAELDSWDI